jgi:hypothetical protein
MGKKCAALSAAGELGARPAVVAGEAFQFFYGFRRKAERRGYRLEEMRYGEDSPGCAFRAAGQFLRGFALGLAQQQLRSLQVIFGDREYEVFANAGGLIAAGDESWHIGLEPGGGEEGLRFAQEPDAFERGERGDGDRLSLFIHRRLGQTSFGGGFQVIAAGVLQDLIGAADIAGADVQFYVRQAGIGNAEGIYMAVQDSRRDSLGLEFRRVQFRFVGRAEPCQQNHSPPIGIRIIQPGNGVVG